MAKQNKFLTLANNENGFVLVISLVLLLLIIVLGTASLNTTSLETQIVGYEKAYQEAFYAAEGGTETGIVLVEENIFDGGFQSSSYGTLNVNSLNLYQQDTPSTPLDWTTVDAYFPAASLGTTPPYTNLKIGGTTSMVAGGSIIMASGYEGTGKGSAGGGSQILFDIWSNQVGNKNSTITIRQQWLHINR